MALEKSRRRHESSRLDMEQAFCQAGIIGGVFLRRQQYQGLTASALGFSYLQWVIIKSQGEQADTCSHIRNHPFRSRNYAPHAGLASWLAFIEIRAGEKASKGVSVFGRRI